MEDSAVNLSGHYKDRLRTASSWSAGEILQPEGIPHGERITRRVAAGRPVRSPTVTRRVLALLLAAAALLAVAAPAQAANLRAGVGRADITPRTGYYLGGWTRADRFGNGQHTRLFASALVLQRGKKKVALVSLDLFMAAGGIVKQAAERAGFSESDVLVSASHTHAGPGGFAN